jgi:hypothetical protein
MRPGLSIFLNAQRTKHNDWALIERYYSSRRRPIGYNSTLVGVILEALSYMATDEHLRTLSDTDLR